MKIAIIAPVIRKISNNNYYGGIERIIASLAIGIAESNIQVVLYAPYGTDIKHKNIEIRITTDKDISKNPKSIKKTETDLFNKIIFDQLEFDIIHSHIEPIVAKNRNDNYYSKILKPIVITMHNQTYIDKNIDYYKTHPNIHNINYVFISNNQSKPLSFLPNKTVIYNGIDIDKFTFNSVPNLNQLAFLGRITPEKGISQAIKIAKLSGKKLLIGAAIDHTQQNFYEQEIKSQIDGENIIYLGEVSNKNKNILLRTSEALISPIQWNEPFGLVVVESLATGTPVIASNMGSMSEIIENNKTGFIINQTDNISTYVNAINKIDKLDRQYCRKSVKKRFSSKIMVNNYLKLYSSILIDNKTT